MGRCAGMALVLGDGAQWDAAAFCHNEYFLHFSISCTPVYCKLQHTANVSITVYFTWIFFSLQITLIRTAFSQQILRNTIKTQEHLMPRLCLSLRRYVICSFPMQICCHRSRIRARECLMYEPPFWKALNKTICCRDNFTKPIPFHGLHLK